MEWQKKQGGEGSDSAFVVPGVEIYMSIYIAKSLIYI